MDCRIAAGATSLEAEDWDTGESVIITLDKEKTPVQVAEGLYRRARKLRRAVDAVAPLLEVAEQEVEYLEQVGGFVAEIWVCSVSVACGGCCGAAAGSG